MSGNYRSARGFQCDQDSSYSEEFQEAGEPTARRLPWKREGLLLLLPATQACLLPRTSSGIYLTPPQTT